MKIPPQSTLASLAVLLTVLNLTSGCSGSREDVRVTLCKGLTSEMMASPQALVWKGNENTFRRPEYVAVKLLFEIPGKDAGETVCFYDYDMPEENAMSHSQPLSAYSTLPDKMLLNGEPVAQSVLTGAVKSQQWKLGGPVEGLVRGD